MNEMQKNEIENLGSRNRDSELRQSRTLGYSISEEQILSSPN